MTTELTTQFALADTATISASIFRPLRRSARQKLDIGIRFGDDELRWRGPDQLGATDQSVLLCLLALAGIHRAQLGAVPGTDHGVALRGALMASGWCASEVAAVVAVRWSSLAREAGFKHGSGGAQAVLRSSLQRLSEVTLWIVSRGMTTQTRLLTWLVGDERTVLVALNFRLAKALFDGQFTKIPLTERRQLSKDTGRILHSWLCAAVREGSVRTFAVDSLVERVYGSQGGGNTLRDRRTRIRFALAEIAELPAWDVSLSRTSARVERLRASGALKAGHAVAPTTDAVTPTLHGPKAPSQAGSSGALASSKNSMSSQKGCGVRQRRPVGAALEIQPHAPQGVMGGEAP